MALRRAKGGSRSHAPVSPVRSSPRLQLSGPLQPLEVPEATESATQIPCSPLAPQPGHG